MCGKRMNLGDGLLFELENGKPKLVLTHNGEPKTSNRTGFYLKNKPLKIAAKLGPKEEERDRKCRDAGGVNYGSQKIRTKSRIDADNKQSQVQSESEIKSADAHENTSQDGVVCLTHKQFQQILNTIKASGQNGHHDSAAPIKNDAGIKEEETEKHTSANGKKQQSNSQGNEQKTLNDFTPMGLFDTLGEREWRKDTIEAQKAQWRRELDEQMALKKQQKEQAKVLAHGERRGATETRTRSGDQRSGIQEGRAKPTGTPAPHSHQTVKALPSAIRSTFLLGEATPLESAFSEEKREQQRRWLQDLEQQREEIKLRRKLEKQSQSQPDDHERWAMHFDSFQKHLPVQNPPTEVHASGNNLSLYSAPSESPSSTWQNMSSYVEDTTGRNSVLNIQGPQPKTSYLRTMTALLDPAQIEAREQKRIKQLEHQRAIVAQMEEHRRQKEKEEAARQAMEQEDERRIAEQRELLHQEHLREVQLLRQKEELKSRKTESLYLSVQKASEEAQKNKHLQRLKHLQRTGADAINPQVVLDQRANSLPTLEQITEAPDTDRKDIAVQTELNPGSPKTSCGIQAAVEYKVPPNNKRSRRENRATEKNSGKENMCTTIKGADIYEAYTRTDKTNGQQQPHSRPDWNTQKPRKAFVPASERYPAELQRHRQESRMRRQTELMTLVERNTPSRSSHQATTPQSENPSHLQREFHSAHQKDREPRKVETAGQRAPSPPIPTLRNRLKSHSRSAVEEKPESSGRSPSSDYVPYVRTDEVYHLDPLGPISRPATHEGAQKKHKDGSQSRQQIPLEQRDPLIHPELLKSTKRQQAILKGLSELRQGLLLKQRELETGFSPLLQEQSRTHSPAFQPP